MRQYRRVYLENKFAIGKDLFYYIFLQSLSLVYCIVYSDTIEHIQFFHQLWTHIIKKIYLFLHSIRFLVEIPTYFIFLQISHTVSQILPLFKDEFHDFSMMYAGNNDLFLIEFYIFIIFFLRFIVLYVQAMLYKMFKKDEMSFFFHLLLLFWLAKYITI